jgi:hypothetical protein
VDDTHPACYRANRTIGRAELNRRCTVYLHAVLGVSRILNDRSVTIPTTNKHQAKALVGGPYGQNTRSITIRINFSTNCRQSFPTGIVGPSIAPSSIPFIANYLTRRICFASCTNNPIESWMRQTACNLTDCEDGFLREPKCLLLDRDSIFTQKFCDTLELSGITP